MKNIVSREYGEDRKYRGNVPRTDEWLQFQWGPDRFEDDDGSESSFRFFSSGIPRALSGRAFMGLCIEAACLIFFII